jgi:amino-acid N-acetyltransferase
MTDPITIERADGDAIDRIETVLDANDLPHADVRSPPGTFFLATDDGERVGVGGLETCGSTGLLRSVVVTEPHHGQGYGRRLCAALEARARSRWVETLYLLTTTAASFFRACGYETVDRESVPPEIRQTTQFSDLCPSSATCLRKDL